MLYSRRKRIALVTRIDKNSYYLDNILYIPKLGINLVLAKKLYKVGYKGAFNNETI